MGNNVFPKILPLWWTTEYFFHLPPPMSLYFPLVSPFPPMFPHPPPPFPDFAPFFFWQREGKFERVTGVPPWAGNQGP